MKNHKFTFIVCCLIFFSFLVSCNKASQTKADSDKVNVIVSILPLADFVRQVGADRVNIDVFIPPGSSPHTFEPLPMQLKAVDRANLMVIIGLNLEFWKEKVLNASGNKKLNIVELSDGIDIIRDDEESEHECNEIHKTNMMLKGNPHIWLSPGNVIFSVARIRDSLIAIDPAGEKEYIENADNYIKKLKELDSEFRTRLERTKNREFISHHSAWVYLARDYGLKQVGAIETSPGKEPSPQHLKEIVEKLKKMKAGVIFAEPQFSPKSAKVIADECGIKVVYIDPIGSLPSGKLSEYSYINLMKKNLDEIVQGLKCQQ